MKTNPQINQCAVPAGIRRTYRDVTRVKTIADGNGRTKQSFKDECDINKILSKYQKTGALTHLNQHSRNYGYASSDDFRESMEIVRTGREMFDDLPSSVRKRFANDPAEFLEFVQDPKNQEELIQLGLATRREATEIKKDDDVTKATEPVTKAPKS